MGKRKLLYILMALAAAGSVSAQSLSFQGNSLRVIEETPEKSTGLEMIYVLYSISGVTASYTSTSGNQIQWMQYGNLGGGHAEKVASTQNGNTSTLTSLEGDKGYIVQDGDRQYCFWITDYSQHRLRLTSVSTSADQECGISIIDVAGSGDPIRYYTINGQQKTIDQEITVEYNTQEWSDQMENFQQTLVSASFESFQSSYRLSPPNYCATRFTVTGDKFLRIWNWVESAESTTVEPTSVDAMTFAISESSADDDTAASNQIGSDDTDGLGGSAPCSISFQAYITDGVIHNEWQLTDDPTFEAIDYRFTTQDLDYTFLDEGTHYLRYIGSNSDGSCEYISDIYEVTIGESQLLIPNAFSPNGDGINDEWKVAYRSILKFDCHIFDRNGHQVCHLTSPDQGWDGKVGGKTVKSGVFYYVIQATGSDGKKYNKSGDINVVRYVGGTSTSSQ